MKVTCATLLSLLFSQNSLLFLLCSNLKNPFLLSLVISNNNAAMPIYPRILWPTFPKWAYWWAFSITEHPKTDVSQLLKALSWDNGAWFYCCSPRTGFNSLKLKLTIQYIWLWWLSVCQLKKNNLFQLCFWRELQLCILRLMWNFFIQKHALSTYNAQQFCEDWGY